MRQTRIYQTDVEFKLSYSFTDLQLKSPLSLIFAVMVADWGFISGLLKIIALVGGWLEARREKEIRILSLLLC
jgi:hypothetical protein